MANAVIPSPVQSNEARTKVFLCARDRLPELLHSEAGQAQGHTGRAINHTHSPLSPHPLHLHPDDTLLWSPHPPSRPSNHQPGWE